MTTIDGYTATGNYKSCKEYVHECGGLLEWKKGGSPHGGWWHIRLGGKHIRFEFKDGWCPLETLVIPNESGHDRDLREDAFFRLAAIFDRDGVERVD
jgi:hypothetical protein